MEVGGNIYETRREMIGKGETGQGGKKLKFDEENEKVDAEQKEKWKEMSPGPKSTTRSIQLMGIINRVLQLCQSNPQKKSNQIPEKMNSSVVLCTF